MKKAYVKPELFCEEYELTTAIAGNCGAEFNAFNVNTSDVKTCTYRMMDHFLFISANMACDEQPTDDELCYQVASPAIMAFSS